MSAPLIYAAVAHHGFGHLAQTAAVLRSLRQRRRFRLLVRSAAPQRKLREHMPPLERHIAVASEPGMAMRNALEVDVEASHAEHLAWTAQWEAALAREAEQLRRLRPDLVLANVSPLVLAAARAAGVPAVALCSLNWADVYGHYCGHLPGADQVRARLLQGYRAADLFLRPEPAMPMAELPNSRGIGPVARLGHDQGEALRRALGWQGRRIVLVSMGGMDLQLPVADWPAREGLGLVVGDAQAGARADVVGVGATGLSFIDLLASADAVVCKPGYGTFAEAACNGVPVLYTRRDDWPEEPYLLDWLQRRGRAAELARGALRRGELAEPLAALWARPQPPPPAPGGLEQAAELLAAYLD